MRSVSDSAFHSARRGATTRRAALSRRGLFPRSVGRTLVAVAILCAVESAGAAGTDPSLFARRKARTRREGPIVTAIHFAGNEMFDRTELLRYMALRESGFFQVTHFDRSVLERDLGNIERFYATQGFSDTEAALEDAQLSPDSLRIELLVGIHEGPRWFVSDVTFEGASDITEKELCEATSLKQGSPLLSKALEADRLAILDEYAGRSYLDARVFQVVEEDAASGTASIHYRVVERDRAVIGSIDVTGDDKTRQYVIEREFEFCIGEHFDYEKIGETQAKIYRTGLFNSVWIEPAPEDTGKVVKRLNVRVRERPSGYFDFGFGYATIDGLQVAAAVTNANIQGQGISLRIQGTYSERERSVSLSTGDPWFTGRRLAADASASYAWSDEVSYVAETSGADFVLTKELTKGVTAEGGYEYERTVVLEGVAEEDAGTSYTTAVLGALTYDTRDNILSARRGMFARAQLDFASSRLGGTNDFSRYELEWRGYKKVRHGRVGALSLCVGWIKPQGDGADVPVNERFFTGGEGSVRGFERNSLSPLDANGEPKGGRALIELRGEIRFPVHKKLRAAAFVDAGQAFDDSDAAKLSELAVGAGVGIRYRTRVGVLRFDVAVPVSEKGPPAYYFGVGQAF